MGSTGRNIYLVEFVLLVAVSAEAEYFLKSENVNGISKSTWMTDLYEKIKDKRLGDIIIPGTYASASHHVGNNIELAVEDHNIFKISKLLNAHKMIPFWEAHSGSLQEQLESGIRYFDLRVIAIKHHFYWHHGFVGDRVECGINQIYNFASQNPREILILSFSKFYQDTTDNSITRQMSNRTFEAFSELLVRQLHGNFVSSNIDSNPLTGDIIQTGHNIIVLMKNQAVPGPYRRYFWNDTSNHTTYDVEFTAYSKEELFETASTNLKRYKCYHSNQLTTVLLNVQSPLSEQLNVLLWEIWLLALLMQIGTCALYLFTVNHCKHRIKKRKRSKERSRLFHLAAVLAINMSFVYSAYYGSRNSAFNQHNVRTENSSEMIFHSGINNMIQRWISRPSLYKCNVILVSDFQTSTVVDSAIAFALGLVRKQVSVSFVGSPLVGYKGIRSWFSCPPVLTSYMIISRDEGKVIMWSSLMEKETVSFYEGQFPMDAMIFISVGSTSGKWYQLYSGNIQHWIDEGLDFYIRGTESRTGRGRAYISYNYNDITWTCLSFPQQALLNNIIWDGNTPATFQHKPSGLIHPNIFQKNARL